MIIIDHFNRITDKIPTKEEEKRIEEMQRLTFEMIQLHKPIMVLNGKEYPMGNYKTKNHGK